MSYTLKNHKMIAFEVTDKCDMKHLHPECPINAQNYNMRHGPLDEERICKAIEEANALGFKGYIEFHYYCEPLLEKEMILNIIKRNKKNKFNLITNGRLLSRNIEENKFLKDFSIIIISCYDMEYMPFYEGLKKQYKNITISKEDKLDNRLEFYNHPKHDTATICGRPFFELPIDHYGDVRLCCFDWKRTCVIGNINETSLTEVVNGDVYQKILQRVMDQDKSELPFACRCCDQNSTEESVMFLNRLRLQNTKGE